MITFLIIAAILVILLLLSMKGRSGHKGLEQLRGWRYAHRGLHDREKPENSMSAFRAALENGYGIELDIHLLKDGNLAVMHDSSLKRTVGEDVIIEDLTTEELKNYRLLGSGEPIPEFREVLELFAGKAPMIIELKEHGGNSAALSETACKMMEGYEGPWCMESFDPRCILWLKKNRPQVIRGQLTANYFAGKSSLPWVLKLVLTHQLGNFLTQPDFVAYNCHHRKTISNTVCRSLWNMQGVTWTITSQKDLDAAEQEGWLPIFEGFRP